MSEALSWRQELSIRVNQRYLKGAEHFPAFKILKKKRKVLQRPLCLGAICHSDSWEQL